MNISSVDLNLLVAFDALMKHGNVTHAAHAIGLSQPAMSNALSRLRELFSDRLLVRSGHGMSPTPRALEAHTKVREALSAIEGVLNKVERFDSARDTRRFRVAFAEDAALYLLPNIAPAIAASPGINMDVLSTAHFSGVDLVLNGTAEASVGLVQKVPPKELRFVKLFRERMVAIAHRGHPAFSNKDNKTLRKLNLAEFLAYPHVAIRPSADSRGRIDEALAKIGKRRRVAFNIPHFMVAPYLVSGSDLIVGVAERVAMKLAKQLDLAVAEVPVGGEPYDACLAWHQRFEQDRGHMWLRQIIIAEGNRLA